MKTLVLATCGAILATLAALKLLPAPWVWICVVWTAVGIIGAVTVRRTQLRFASLTVATVACALGVFEAWLWVGPRPVEPILDRDPEYVERDATLGWRLAPHRATRAVERLGDAVLYDVTYTTDSAGRRVAPPGSNARASGCVWFFVCSFTFGEGVPDSVTLPYRVGVRTAGRFRTVNFGAPGYGAEHMLAALASHRDDPSACRPTHVVYTALPHHVARAAGQTEYSRLGPRYDRLPNGTLEFKGTVFQPQERGGLGAEIEEQLAKARTYHLIADRPRRGDEALAKYTAIVRAARDTLKARYPAAQFDILAWDLHAAYAGGFPRFVDSLRAITTRVHIATDQLPGYDSVPVRYQIHVRDAHPNALAHDLLSRYVADQILGVPQP